MAKIVRTPTEASGGITPEEKAAMAEHVKLWISRAFRTGRTDPAELMPAIEGIYAAAKLARPRVVIVPSPLVMAFAFGAASSIWAAREQKGRNEPVGSLSAATAFLSPAENALHKAVQLATQEAFPVVEDQASVRSVFTATDQAADVTDLVATLRKACVDLGGSEGLKFAKSWASAHQGGNMWAGFESYLTACRDILGLRLPEHEPYAHWERAAIHGGFRVMHEKFCIVSDFPDVIKVDDRNLPHCENGPTHRWSDGWALYHWHGVRVPQNWIEDCPSLTATIALKQENTELRRAACEIIGWKNILTKLKAKTIQKDPDPKIGELVEVTLEGNKERFLKVLCGTGREFAIPVPREMKTALQANSWSYDVPENVIKSIERRT